MNNTKFMALLFINLIIFMPIAFSLEISNVYVSAGNSDAVVTWDTDDAADSRVDYGTIPTYGKYELIGAYETDHSVKLSNLQGGAKYYYQIRSTDQNGATSYYPGFFKTKDSTPPQKITNLRNGSIGSTDAYLKWDKTTDTDIQQYLVYKNSVLIGTPTVEMYYATGLNEGTQYSFYVKANDTSGNLGEKSDTISIKTKDTTAPVKTTGLKTGLISNTTISLLWDRNSEPDFKEYIIYRNNAEINRTTTNSYKDSGLALTTKYTYSIATVDESLNIGAKSDSIDATTTQSPSGYFKIMNISVQGSTVNWQTSDYSNSSVNYGERSISELFSSIEENTLFHSVTLHDIEDGKRYVYNIESCTESSCVRSQISSFIAGYSSSMPEINAEIPQYYSLNRLNFNGTTKPQSSVQVFVNNVLRGTHPNTGDDGAFKFTNIQLDEGNPINIIRIATKDFMGNNNSKEYTLNLDTNPLIINVTLPYASSSQNLDIKGSVNKKASIKIYVLESTGSAPAKPENLTLTTQGNALSLRWNAVNNSDKYLIYRSDIGLLATTSYTYYSDSKINASKSYTYFIAAMDRSCTIGASSDPLTIASASSLNNDNAVAENSSCSITPQRTISEVEPNVNFTTSVQLSEGTNLVRIEAAGFSGESSLLEGEVIYDTSPVKILNPTDISQYSPVYVPEVKINGQVSKKATVNVYLNKATTITKSIETDKDGYFTLELDLTNYNTDRTNTTTVDYTYNDPSASRDTEIRIVAVDYLGQTSNAVTGTITYAMCGYGFWWKINNTKPMPDVLIPELMRQGIAQVGMSYAIAWQGGSGDENKTYMTASIFKRVLSQKESENWDLQWVSSITTQATSDKKKGYVSILLKAIDPFPGDKSKTDLERDNNLSSHRYTEKISPTATIGDQYSCSTPATGCVKIPLVMEVKFKEGNDTKVQRQCWDVEVSIDKRINPNVLSKGFLLRSIRFFNNSLELIDSVLKPLDKIIPYVFYGCVGSMAFLYIWSQWDAITNALSNIGSKTDDKDKIDKSVPEYGMEACNKIYCVTPTDSKDQDHATNRCNACKKRATSIEDQKSFEKKSRLLCDRIASPAVPTFQKFVKSKTKTGSQEVEVINGNGIKLNKAHVCSGVQTNADSVTKLYLDKKYNGKSVTVQTSKGDISIQKYCEEGMPYAGVFDRAEDKINKELCCMYSYVGEWSSGCLLMEIDQQSACIAAEASGNKPYLADANNGCNTLVSKATGLCQKNGQAEPEIVSTYKEIDNKTAEACTGGIPKAALTKPYLYFFISAPDPNSKVYEVHSGVIIEKLNVANDKANADGKKNLAGKTEAGNTNLISLNPTTNLLKLEDYSIYFRDNNLKEITAEDVKQYPGYKVGDKVGMSGFYAELTKNRDCITGLNPDSSKKIYNDIYNTIGVPDQQYVADPTSGIISSIQCVSLTAFREYLNHWKTIITLLRDCFQTILLTGDGSAGACKSLVTEQLCDIIYDFISCFVQKYGAGAGGTSDYNGIGGIFGAMSDAGSRVSSSVKDRYGDTTTFNAMFADRKLVHAICLFAFTGDWTFDLNAVLQATQNIPIESTAMVAESTRRFISYNPVAQANGQKGLTTYNYHMALVLIAGSDINYHVKLYCSNDFSCTDLDYNTNGACDCTQGGAVSGAGIGSTQGVSFGPNYIDITGLFGSGQLKKGATLNLEKNFIATSHKVRYDRIELSYEPVDAKNAPKKKGEPATKHITLEGGQPPVECQFDVTALSYRCSVNFDNENWIKINDVSADPLLRVGEELRVNADLTNKIPAGGECSAREDCEYTKYVRMKVTRDDASQTQIWRETDGVAKLNSNNAVNLALPRDFQDGKEFRIASNHVAESSKPRVYIKDSGTGVTTEDLTSNPIGLENLFAIRFDTLPAYSICSVTKNPQGEYSAPSNCIPAGTVETTTAGQVTTNIVRYKGLALRVTNPIKDGYITVEYTPPTSQCKDRVKFTAEVSVYNARYNPTTAMYERGAISMYEGTENKMTKEFYVECPTTTSAASKIQITDFTTSVSASNAANSIASLTTNAPFRFALKFAKDREKEISAIVLYESYDKINWNKINTITNAEPFTTQIKNGEVGWDIEAPTAAKYYKAIIFSIIDGTSMGETSLFEIKP